MRIGLTGSMGDEIVGRLNSSHVRLNVAHFLDKRFFCNDVSGGGPEAFGAGINFDRDRQHFASGQRIRQNILPSFSFEPVKCVFVEICC